MQFVGKVITSVSEFYKDINPSTLSGAIDILVVEDVRTGQLSCSPFHVRFGKLHLLRPQEKVVEMRVNGRPVDIKMKVGEAGETFFVLPTSHAVSEEYLTSPLVTAMADGKAIEPLRLSPVKDRRGSESDGEDGIAKSVLNENGIERRHALSDSEVDVLELGMHSSTKTVPIPKSGKIIDSMPMESPPKYSWMWGGLPQKTGKSSELSKDGISVTETKEEKSAFTKVGVFEYVNRPSIFRTNYDALANLIEEHKSEIRIYKTKSGTDEIIIEEGDMLPESLLTQLESSLVRMEWTSIADDPSSALADLTDNKTTVIVVDSRIFFSGQIGYTLLVGRILFGKLMSYEAVLRKFPQLNPNSANKIKKDERRSSWRWWSRSSTAASTISSDGKTLNPISPPRSIVSDSPERIHSPGTTLIEAINIPLPPSPTSSPVDERIYYTKSLRLPHEMLEQLELQMGINSISFTVTTKLQGTATCTARIFRWKSDARIVISDIDGTITKSDALGHLFAFVGKDWTHANIANLYTNISKNGYHFVYLSSRSLGQANVTRGYLKGIEQDKFQLPDGPVIMSPDRLLAALRREVVLGIPQEFKIACLKDLQQLFYNCVHEGGEPSNPFYAGFGNRTNDANAYLAIGIPPPRVFIINPAGTVSVEPLADRYASSYAQLIELVDSIFPPLCRAPIAIEEPYNEFWYWRRPISLAPLVDVERKDVAIVAADIRGATEDEEEEEGLVPAYYV